MSEQRKRQIGWALLAAVLLAGAGLVRETRPTKADVWEILPGRAFYVNYLWIRASELQEEGKYYDAYQQAALICKLQRHFPEVWSFQAWNMAWNISAETKTPQERWLWVYNGVRLLRDEGIRYNPDSIVLHSQLSWIYLFKIGGYLDDMHWVYKRQWAVRMQDLLGAPPQGTTQEVLDAFAVLADESLIDKDLQWRGRAPVQDWKLAELLQEPAVKAYADALDDAGLNVRSNPTDFLALYNLWSLSDDVAAVRLVVPRPKTVEEVRQSMLINSAEHRVGRARLLAFLRAQILWNVYKMDPAFMLELMKQYGPLDWRLSQPHAMYWALLGRKIAREQSLDEIEVINTQRYAFNCLKELTWRGRLTMIDYRARREGADAMAVEPVQTESQMQVPQIRLYQFSDLRYIEPLHQSFVRNIEQHVRDSNTPFKRNLFRDGHVNYLAGAIKSLYAARRVKEAQKYLDYVRREYRPIGPNWQFTDVGEFVEYELRTDGMPIRDLAESQVALAITTGYVALATGDRATAGESFDYARRAYSVYQEGRTERMRLQHLRVYFVNLAIRLLAAPREMGYSLSLTERSILYRNLNEDTQRLVYPSVAEALSRQCEANNMNADGLFPPPGDEEAREQ